MFYRTVIYKDIVRIIFLQETWPALMLAFRTSLSWVMNEEFGINLRMRCHNYIDLFWCSATYKQLPNFFNLSILDLQSVAYLEIILPGIILFQGNMGSRQYFPLIQVLITPLCLWNSQSYFLTSTFTLPSQAPITCQTRKRRQVAH